MELSNVIKGSQNMIPCPYEGCSSMFNKLNRLTKHLFVHSNYRAFVCPDEACSKAYTTKSHLDRHIKNVHMKDMSDVIVYSCPSCWKKYANRQNLKRHYKTQHLDGKKPFLCDICNLTFKKKNQLSEHMYRHNGIKSFVCEICSAEYVTHYEKRRHMRCHKMHKCETCGAEFNQWSKYVLHKKSHTENREYICDNCGKVFKQRCDIVRHVKIHLGESKPFLCPIEGCYRRYSRNTNLRQHIMIKHHRITHDCTICGRELCTKDKLNQHMIRLHSIPEILVKPPKTLKTGRSKRKDENSMKVSAALKLAGIPQAKIDRLNISITPSTSAIVDS